MNKIHFGKTATSRSRKKNIIEDVRNKIKLPQDDFTKYLLGKNYSNTSIESFIGDVKKFKSWVEKENIEIENIGYNDITSYLQSFSNIAQQTKGCYLRGVKKYFNFLVQKEERTDNPAEFIQLKGLKRKTLYDILNRQELDNLYHHYTLPDEANSKDRNQNWFKAKVLAQKRNKVILGLMLYQALDARDLKLLTVNDIKLREGKIFIPGTRKSNERELKLEALQIIDVMEYLLTTRAALLQLRQRQFEAEGGNHGKQSDVGTEHLFISIGTSERIANMMAYFVKRLNQLNKNVTSVKQLKASVIVHWLKRYNLRQVQYMAGHRYVSSTESFLVNEMEGMMEDIEKYHPIG
jgi:integrase/recombinase XerD